MRRVACSMTARMYTRTPARVTVSMKSAASNALACERRKSAQVVAVRSGAGSMPASRRISQTVDGATFHAEYQQFAVHPPISPAAVFPGQAQYQGADRAQGARSSAPRGSEDGGVVAGDQVAMPPEDGVGAYQQSQAAQCRSRQRMQ